MDEDIIPEDDQEPWPRLIHAILEGQQDTIQKLLDEHPELATTTDTQGNTALHYAIAGFKRSVIEFLVKKENIRRGVVIANSQGKTAIDLWKLAVKSTSFQVDPADMRGLTPLIAQGYHKNVRGFLSGGVSHELRCGDLTNLIQLPLHLAIRYQRWPIVDLLLDHLRASEVSKVLNTVDSNGLTPLLLAQGQPEDPKATEAFIRMRDMQAAATRPVILEPNQPIENPMRLLSSEGHRQPISMLAMLERKLLRGITTADDLEFMRATLPIFCSWAYFACRQALREPRTIEQRLAKRKLLERLSGNKIDQLQQTIGTMVEYLEDILRNGRVYELIEFSTKRKSMGHMEIDALLPTGGKIYLNPEEVTNAWMLLLTLIHEISHIATMSYDVAYASAGSITEDGYDLQFGSLVKLAAKAEGSRLPPEKSWVLDILWSLENSSNQRSAPTLGEVYAAHNAETIATCILGVFVINSNYGFLDFEKNILHAKADILSIHHLEKLWQQYAAELALPGTPEITPATSNNPGLIPSSLDFCKGGPKRSNSVPRTPTTVNCFDSPVPDADKSPSDGSRGSASTAASTPEQRATPPTPTLSHHMSAALDAPNLVGNTFFGEKESISTLEPSPVSQSSSTTRPC